ncbi:MAG: FHA domain-containing protein, partial [Actinomycetaceae bacterium]|nr:FHA domain-containing protein [Actinomycetaceae bacterium]
ASSHTYSLASEQSVAHRFSLTRMRDGQRVEWEKAVVTVGRSSAADICMEGNLDISRIHLQIRPDGLGGFEVTDLGSTNGTRVADTVLHRDQSVYMQSGETFEIGGEQFLLENIS